MSETMKASQEFERDLFAALTEAHVQAISEFGVKRESGKMFRADLFIPFPQRAIVETKVFRGGSAVLADASRRISQARRKLEEVRREFDGNVYCFLVIVDIDNRLAQLHLDRDWMIPIIVTGSSAAKDAAFFIRNTLCHGLPPARLAALRKDDLADVISETGVLADVLVNFQARIDHEAFRVLKLETEGLLREYKSGHYTTAALCVGRTIEFVVYTLAKAWGVPINKRTISLLQGLEQKFEEVSRAVVDFAYAEEDSDRARIQKRIQKALADLSLGVNEIPWSLQSHHEKITTEYPVNLQSILRDIRKKFSSVETVRKEIDVLTSGKMLEGVLKKRNRAAHADTSGSRTEYQRADVDELLQDLRSILFSLGNIADAIDKR